MKEVIFQDPTELMKILKKCRIWCIQVFKYQIYDYATKFRLSYVLIKRPELWPSNCILQHDSVLAYKALSVKEFLAQKLFAELEHPPYSHDLGPNDFWLFTKIKSTLKGLRFQDIEDINESDDGTESYSTTGVPAVATSLG
jgi:hypothetical protein